MSAGEERTEEATPRRRARSLARGLRAHSAMAATTAALAAGGVPAWLFACLVLTWRQTMAMAALSASHAQTDCSTARMVATALAVFRGSHAADVVAAASTSALVASVISAFASGSLAFAPLALMPQPSRILGRAGFARVLSGEGLGQAAMMCLSVAVVAAIALLPALMVGIFELWRTDDIFVQLGVATRALIQVWIRTVITVAAFAVVDVYLQRRRSARSIKMTPREIREERAQTEGRPEIKQRRRAVGARRARNLRIAAIRRATAVITNPTHVAVALRYAPPEIDVPIVVARAARLLAPVLRAVARASDVPIIESPELARMLYERVEVDEPIPEESYAAVAAIFTWIMRVCGPLRGGDEGER